MHRFIYLGHFVNKKQGRKWHLRTYAPEKLEVSNSFNKYLFYNQQIKVHFCYTNF